MLSPSTNDTRVNQELTFASNPTEVPSQRYWPCNLLEIRSSPTALGRNQSSNKRRNLHNLSDCDGIRQIFSNKLRDGVPS